jgi:acetyltransferase-like isoleucine patch superfamily enzyme
VSAAPERYQHVQRQVASTSALRAYQDLVVGSRAWATLVHYEIVAGWGAALPGALGLAFRKRLWPALFAAAGRGGVWGRNVVIRRPDKMWFGGHVVVDDECYLDAKGCARGEFRIGDDAFISRGCIVSGKDGPLHIGARTNVGARCTLYASNRLEIGADCLLAAHCYVGGGRYDPHGRPDVPIAHQALPRRGVVIEDGCWLGAGVVVVDGVRIGRGSVIGAGAVVTEDVAAWSIAAGVPARQIGRRAAAPPTGASPEPPAPMPSPL